MKKLLTVCAMSIIMSGCATTTVETINGLSITKSVYSQSETTYEMTLTSILTDDVIDAAQMTTVCNPAVSHDVGYLLFTDSPLQSSYAGTTDSVSSVVAFYNDGHRAHRMRTEWTASPYSIYMYADGTHSKTIDRIASNSNIMMIDVFMRTYAFDASKIAKFAKLCEMAK